MIIDFHTHAFPDKIAEKTVKFLGEQSNIKPHTDGTAGGLISSMERAGIDYSVVLPIATKPSQAETINTYAAEISGKNGIVSFGSVHPFSENWRAEIDRVSSLGLKGIKLHPDYQGFFIDDESVFPVIAYAVQLGLTVIFHSGIDIGIPGAIHCTPEGAVKLIDAIGGEGLVFAHAGGFGVWDRVEECLAGRNVYFDISYSLGIISDEQLLRIIRRHDSERCLFGTDSPWGDQSADVDRIKRLGLDKTELDDIMYKNGARLLGIEVVA